MEPTGQRFGSRTPAASLWATLACAVLAAVLSIGPLTMPTPALAQEPEGERAPSASPGPSSAVARSPTRTSATVSLSAASGPEGDSGVTWLTFVLQVTGSFDGTISGIYQTRGLGEGYPPGHSAATASPGIDYGTTKGSFSFSRSGDTEYIDVPVYGDTDVEPDEFFYLQILSIDSSATCTTRAPS